MLPLTTEELSAITHWAQDWNTLSRSFYPISEPSCLIKKKQPHLPIERLIDLYGLILCFLSLVRICFYLFKRFK